MAYSTIESNKLNYFNYEFEDFIYSNVRSNSKYRYLRCILYRKLKCKGFGKIDLYSNQFIPTQDHNHDTDAYKTQQIDLRNKLKRAAETSSDRLRDIFNDTCRNHQEAASISYRNTRCIMSKRRMLQIPGMPKTAVEFSQLLVYSRYSYMHKATVCVDNSVGTIFVSDKMILVAKSCKRICFDGTFYTVPKIFYQLFTIFCIQDEHTIPIIHVLMTNKSEELYKACINRVVEIIPCFKPDVAVSDFEIAPRNAFQSQFPHIHITGCLFHYTQAIWNGVRKSKLASVYSTNYDFMKWIRCIMALPLLPQDKIPSIFNILEDQRLDISPSEEINVAKFKKYVKKLWIIKEKYLSVFETANTTNNGCETYHKNLKSRIKTHRPNIWSFLDCLEEILSDFDLEYARLEQGLEISYPGKKQHKENASKRDKCKEKLSSGIYGPLEYLIEVSSTIGKQPSKDLIECNLENEFLDQISDEDENVIEHRQQCVVCLRIRQETHVLVPCGHGNLCSDCAIQIMSADIKRCPTCRSEIIQSVRLFQ